MANETILIVDADQKSQRVLEVSFKKAGYRVIMTDSVVQALEYVVAATPDIIISDTQFPDGTDGFDFLEAIKADPKSGDIPFLFLTEERALDRKMKGFELGADDYLTKPVYIKEVTTRVELLLQKRAKERLTGAESDEFEGKLSDITMIDLLQMIEGSGRSGSIRLTRDDRTAVVTFHEGDIYDAICGKLQGEEAIYRLLLWPEGEFVVRYHDDIGKVDQIDKESGELLLEGIRRLEKWNEQIAQLPPLGSTLEANFAALAGALDQMPAEVARIARLFDGVRTIRDVVDDSPIDDVTTLQITSRLLDDGILNDITPEEAAPERAAPTNLAAWLEGKEIGGRQRSTTSPGGRVGTTTAGNDRPHRETERLEAESRDPWERRKTQRIDREEEQQRSGERTGTRTSETPAARASQEGAPEGEGLETDGDWNFHFDGAEDAIKRIEEDERRRRELEAQQLYGDRGSSGTLQQTPAVSRESGEVLVPTREAVAETSSATGRAETPTVDLTDLEEAERQRREIEAENLERQRKLVENAGKRLIDGSPRLPGAAAETIERPATPTAGVEPVTPETLESDTQEGFEVEEPELETEGVAGRETDEVEEVSDRRRTRKPTPISAPALATGSAVSLDEESERPRSETPREQTPAERREAAVDEAEAVAREAEEDVRKSAPHEAVSIDEAPIDDAFAISEVSEVSDTAEEEEPPEERSDEADEAKEELEAAEAEAPEDEAIERAVDASGGLGAEVSEADAFLDETPDPFEEQGAQPAGGYDEVVAVSAYESSESEEEIDRTERTTKRMRQPNFANLTPLGEEVSEPIVSEDETLGLDESTAPGEMEPSEIEAALEMLPEVQRHSHDQEVVTAEYDLAAISRRRRESNQRVDESAEDRKERIKAAAEAAARHAIVTTTGLDPDEFVGPEPEPEDVDASTEVWTNPEMMARVDEIAEAWAGAPDSEIRETDHDYDMIDISEADEVYGEVGDDETIDIADDTDPPIGEAAEEVTAAEVAELETLELDEEEKAGVEAEPEEEAEAEPEEETDEEEREAEEAEEAEKSAEEGAVAALSDHSQESEFLTDFEPESYEYHEEEETPRWMLGIAGFLLLAVVAGLVAVIIVSAQEDEFDAGVTVTTPDQPVEPEVPAEPEEPEQPEIAGLDPEAATLEAETSGQDVEASATEVSMLLAGLDPLVTTDAGMPDAPDAGAPEFAATEPAVIEPSDATEPEKPEEPEQPTELTPDQQVQAAERLVNRERFDKAISMLEDLARSQPNNGRIPYLHGVAAVSTGRNSEAIEKFERAKKLGYAPARLHLELGGAYFIAGNKSKAKESYEKFLEKEPQGNEADQVRTILQTQF